MLIQETSRIIIKASIQSKNSKRLELKLIRQSSSQENKNGNMTRKLQFKKNSKKVKETTFLLQLLLLYKECLDTNSICRFSNTLRMKVLSKVQLKSKSKELSTLKLQMVSSSNIISFKRCLRNLRSINKCRKNIKLARWQSNPGSTMYLALNLFTLASTMSLLHINIMSMI